MITLKEAESIATQYIEQLQREMNEPLLITKTQEESFGWVFFYQSKDYLETQSISSMLAGNAPFIVDNISGAIHVLGTANPVEVYIQEYAQLNRQ